MEIAKRCNFSFNFGKTHLPSLQLPNNDDSDTALALQAKAGLGEQLSGQYESRLAHELEVIQKMGFADYFLIVADFVNWAKKQGVPVGPGRGSGAGSLVAYALNITTLDPIKHKLLFERFLNPARVSLPDFDIDFCVEGRDRVIEYVTKKYGADHVCQIVTFGTIGAKGAVRDCGRVLGLPYGKCDSLARMIPHALDMTLKRAINETPALKEAVDNDEEYAQIFALAEKVEGLPRNIGTHAGGVLIAPKPIAEFCPLFAADDTQSLVSQFDMNDVEKLGLVKFDFLGLKTLTILHHAEKYLKQSGLWAEDFSWEDLPLKDKKVFTVYTEANTIGVFQCESPGMRQLMQKLKPDDFRDITALLALFRPGPLNSGMADSYIRRKHGEEETVYPHDLAKTALSETYGVFVYQEQVMEVARRLAGYTLAKADLLRRAMGKKKPEEMAEQKAHFLAGINDKMPTAKAHNLFEDISKFAGYGFNKSHAAAYALLSYRTAYLKAHYPAVLYAAVMSADRGDTDRLRLLVGCAKRENITVLKPDINDGAQDFFVIDKSKIQYGLSAIKGLGDGVVEEITRRRGDTDFVDLFDVCQRLKGGQVRQAALENLITAGALDRFHQSRAALLTTLPSAINAATENSGSLFGASSKALAQQKPWSKSETLKREKQALGFCLSASFYSLYAKFLESAGLNPAKLKDMPTGGEVFIAGVFVKKPASGKARRHGFEIFLLEDDSDTVEVRIDTQLAAELGDIEEGALILVEGAAKINYIGESSVNASRAYNWDDFIQKRTSSLRVCCSDTADVSALTNILAPQKSKNNGAKVFVAYDNGGGNYVISLNGQWHITPLLLDKLSAEIRGINDIKVEYRSGRT